MILIGQNLAICSEGSADKAFSVLITLETLKIRSRSPKSHNLLRSSQYFHQYLAIGSDRVQIFKVFLLSNFGMTVI